MEKHSKVIQRMAQVIPFSQTGDFYFEKALQAFEEEESDKALKYLTRANKENARNPQLLTNVGVALTERRLSRCQRAFSPCDSSYGRYIRKLLLLYSQQLCASWTV